MNVDQLINFLAAITLMEMMLTTGLGVNLSDVIQVSKHWGLIARAAVANYIFVPAAAVGLLRTFHAKPMIAVGFLIVAVCPGAPYGPPFTSIAKGNVTLAVGLMVVLAASSALFAPLLLGILLPFLTGDNGLRIDVAKMLKTLLGAQLVPLCLGLWVRHEWYRVAAMVRRPAEIVSLSLNLLLLTVIVAVQFRMLSGIHAKGYFGMLCLLAASIAAGWIVCMTSKDSSKTMIFTTSVRNVGVALVVATACFPGTPAVSSVTAYGLFQTILMACVALLWGRMTPTLTLVNKKAA